MLPKDTLLKKRMLAFFSALLLAPSALAQDLKTVPYVDLGLYLGTWYEIASIPAVFQNPNCIGTSATYTKNTDGSVKVWNQCYIPPDGRLDRIEGRATVADLISNAKLKVSFFGPFAGDYWIIDLDQNYAYAVVGHPSRNYLWILSRTPEMDPQLYASILKRVQSQDYDIKRIKRTPSLAEGFSRSSEL
jgi:apolipoprotein D and lipocalin family protein